MSDYKNTAGGRIKYYRKVCGMSQEELAYMVGLSSKHISTLENGEATMSIETLEKLCSCFGVMPNDILLEPVTEEMLLKKRKRTPEELLIRARVHARALYYSLSGMEDEAEK